MGGESEEQRIGCWILGRKVGMGELWGFVYSRMNFSGIRDFDRFKDVKLFYLGI